MSEDTSARGAVSPLFESRLDLPDRRKGKVREVYRIPGEAKIAIVASDRISAFDVVMPTPIPGKGALLTEVAAFWQGADAKSRARYRDLYEPRALEMGAAEDVEEEGKVLMDVSSQKTGHDAK